ncbi:MAG: mechanosensitive ion channel family protein [Cyclobacteriaceae bacterium]|nr:mechanosensitive ion channel family protein [Cyclobacteriaceae bacterium]
MMEEYRIEIIESVVILFLYLAVRFVLNKAVEKVTLKFTHQRARTKIIKKFVNSFLLFVGLQFLLFVWGVEQSELIFFISTMLTVLGIAFFAQWSIISNVTSALIIFFSHPAKIGDTITVLDKDYSIKGRISDIEMFFITIKTEEGDKVTIPNNVFIQKMIKQGKSA